MDPTTAPSPDELPFDKADVSEESPLTCHACQRQLFDVYFEVDSQPSCEMCRYEIESERNHGSGPGRFVRALAAGGFAGLVGASLYYAVLALTGYEVGLVAIVVGFLVGFGVRWGSRGRGGWPYQVLAVTITYVAIVSTYVPFIFEEIQKVEATEVAGASAPGTVAEATLENPTEAVMVPASGEPSASLELEEEISAGQAVAALALFSVFVLAIPFLGGFENILGILIIGFGLYQAWKINQRQPLRIEGPFQVGKVAA
ncbi:MAG: hypothetical protein LJF30_07950 [Acidobacteria bacterium]|jgi:hypothetical protein|nr:hypothetical protein [Acidobacteriota bacterium]